MEESILRSIAEEFKKRPEFKADLSIFYRTSADATMYNIPCVVMSHPHAIDPKGRHRKPLKLVVGDGVLILTKQSFPMYNPEHEFLATFELANPHSFCVDKIYEKVMTIFNEHNN